MKIMQPLRPHQSALLGAAALSALFWALPGLQWVIVPLSYLNTQIHELCHALAAVATGGVPHEIIVFPDGSGVTPTSGGFMPLVAAAGYVGAAVVGMAMLMIGRTEPSARMVLRVLAVVMGLGLVLWQHNPVSNGFGILTGLFWITALVVFSNYAKGSTLIFGVQFVAVQQGINAIRSLIDLLIISSRTAAHSDAMIMQSQTGIPALIWAGIWCGISAVLLMQGLRKAWTAPTPVRTYRAG